MDILKIELNDEKNKLTLKIRSELVKTDYLLSKYSRTNMDYVTVYLQNSPIEAYASLDGDYLVFDITFNEKVIKRVLTGTLLLNPSKEVYLDKVRKSETEDYTTLVEQLIIRISNTIYATEYKDISLRLLSDVEEVVKNMRI